MDAQWWAELVGAGERFDAAYALEELAELVMPRVRRPLLRRELELGVAVGVRHRNRPGDAELAGQAAAATARLAAVQQRWAERDDPADAAPAQAVLHALSGRYAEAAAAAEPVTGATPLRRVYLTALRLPQFDTAMALRLLDAGRPVAEAVRSGSLTGRYAYWPQWLRQIVVERALAGTLDEGTVAALDACAYARLSPGQARMARRLLGGDPGLISDAARRLDGLGEQAAAQRLADGDIATVALAARLMAL